MSEKFKYFNNLKPPWKNFFLGVIFKLPIQHHTHNHRIEPSIEIDENQMNRKGSFV